MEVVQPIADKSKPVEGEVDAATAQRMARLDAMGASLSRKRREAIEYRRSTGIEEEWDEDEDAHNGVDEASKINQNAFRTKPPGQIMVRPAGDENLSTEVLNITKPYVNAFASKIIDMRLAIKDRAWAFSPTAIPELEDAAKTQRHLTLVKDGQPVIVSENGQQRQANMGDMAKRDMEIATRAAEKAQKQVDDWMNESKWDSEARQVLDDMARIGTGILKGPFPQKCVYVKFTGGELVRTEKIKPWSKRINARDFFPDPACGEDIHNGDYVFERDYLTDKRVRDLRTLKDAKGNPIYIAEAIDAVLKEGPRLPDVEYDPDKPFDPAQKSKPYQIWYMTGNLNKDDIEAAGCECEGDHETFPVIVAMINDHVIRASRNPLDNGKFPYDVAPCSRRAGHWAGIGIGRDLRTPQRMATGATRAMLENAGLSAKPIIALMQSLLVPNDGENTLYGGKIFIIPKGTDIQAAKDAIFSFQIESRQQECMAIIQFALKMCEDVTGLPMILQGQQGKAPDVLGVVQILNENATSVARRVAKMYDDNLLEPHVTRYYDWLMQYSEDDEAKGDYTIDVLPPPDVMADKAALTELTKLSERPASKVDPAKLFAEFAKSNRFDPDRIQYSDDEWKRIQSQQQPGDPRVEVAKIRAETDAKIEASRVQFETQDNERERQNKLVVAAIDERMNSTQLTSDERQNLEKIKATLAGKAIEISAQAKITRDNQLLDLNRHNVDTTVAREKHAADVIKKTGAEPTGKAPNGQAFIQ